MISYPWADKSPPQLMINLATFSGNYLQTYRVERRFVRRSWSCRGEWPGGPQPLRGCKRRCPRTEDRLPEHRAVSRCMVPLVPVSDCKVFLDRHIGKMAVFSSIWKQIIQ